MFFYDYTTHNKIHIIKTELRIMLLFKLYLRKNTK